MKGVQRGVAELEYGRAGGKHRRQGRSQVSGIGVDIGDGNSSSGVKRPGAVSEVQVRAIEQGGSGSREGFQSN